MAIEKDLGVRNVRIGGAARAREPEAARRDGGFLAPAPGSSAIHGEVAAAEAAAAGDGALHSGENVLGGPGVQRAMSEPSPGQVELDPLTLFRICLQAEEKFREGILKMTQEGRTSSSFFSTTDVRAPEDPPRPPPGPLRKGFITSPSSGLRRCPLCRMSCCQGAW